MNLQPQILQDHVLKLLLAGKAYVTFKSKATENRYTYKVSLSKDKKVYFVSVFTGSDNANSRHYTYIGIIRNNEFINKCSNNLSKPAQGFHFIFANLVKENKEQVNKVEIWHEGKCCKCGRKLTVPESIALGLGPECRQYLAK